MPPTSQIHEMKWTTITPPSNDTNGQLELAAKKRIVTGHLEYLNGKAIKDVKFSRNQPFRVHRVMLNKGDGVKLKNKFKIIDRHTVISMDGRAGYRYLYIFGIAKNQHRKPLLKVIRVNHGRDGLSYNLKSSRVIMTKLPTPAPSSTIKRSTPKKPPVNRWNLNKPLVRVFDA